MRLLPRLRRRRRLHLLHLRKTGGTALNAALREHETGRDFRIVLHPHSFKLRDVPESDLFMFWARDPLTRFVSGFHSRLREGRPRYVNPWTEAERAAFERYRTPGELARSLASPDGAVRFAAEGAMRSIAHVRSSYWDWFESEEYLRSRLGGLFFVGRQETLAADFEALRGALGLPASLQLPTDDVMAHRTPPDADRSLDPTAVDALRRWYARDFDFVELCEELRERARVVRGKASSGPPSQRE